MVKIIVSLLLTILLSTQANADVRAEINKSHIAMTDTLLLTISVDGSVSRIKPDLSGVQENFEIVSTSANQRYSFINGVATQRMEWRYQLVPLKIGKITIPAMNISGQMTQPLMVVVSENIPDANLQKKLFIEVSATPNNVYVQSQLLLTQKIYSLGPLPENATLSEPSVTEGMAEIEFLKQNDPVMEKKEGVTYRVIERHYSVYPHKSGTLSFSPAIFNGYVNDQSAALRFPFTSFRGKRVRVLSNKLTLNVLPQPTQFSGKEWLPAQNIEIHGSWSSSVDTMKVGEPITLTLGIIASGLKADQLPDLTIKLPDHFKVYPEINNLQNNKTQGLIIGIKTQKITLIPSQSGTFSFPDLSLAWWDVINNKEKTAVLAGKTLIVSGSSNSPEKTNQTASVKTDLDALNSNAPVIKEDKNQHKNTDKITDTERLQERNWWDISLAVIAGLLLAGTFWLISLIIRQLKEEKQKKQTFSKPKQSLKNVNKELKEACLNNNAAKTNQLLLLWAEKRFQQPANLAMIIEKSSPAISQAVKQLHATLYAQHKKQWTGGEALWNALSKDANQQPVKPKKEQGLKALYPD